MHWLNVRMPVSSSATSAGGNWSSMPTGSRRWQAFSAAWYWELVTPSCCAPGNFTLLRACLGVGKFGTPCERMQWEKATSWEFAAPELADPPAFVEPPEPVDDGPPPQAAADRTRAADAT